MLYVFSSIDVALLYQQFQRINIIWYILGVLLVLLNIFFSSYKWWVILRFEKMSFSFSKILKIYWIGFFFNQFLPGRIGGDVIKMSLLLGKKPAKIDYKASVSVFIDRLFNLTGLLVVGFFGIIYYLGNVTKDIYYLPLFILVIGIVFLGLSFGPKIIDFILKKRKWDTLYKLKKLLIIIKEYYNKPYKVIFLILSASLFQLLVVVLNWILSISLSFNVDFTYFLFFIPLLAIITLIPISWGGFGLREYSYILFLQKVGIQDEQSLALSFLIYFTVLISAIPGIFFFNYERKK